MSNQAWRRARKHSSKQETPRHPGREVITSDLGVSTLEPQAQWKRRERENRETSGRAAEQRPPRPPCPPLPPLRLGGRRSGCGLSLARVQDHEQRVDPGHLLGRAGGAAQQCAGVPRTPASAPAACVASSAPPTRDVRKASAVPSTASPADPAREGRGESRRAGSVTPLRPGLREDAPPLPGGGLFSPRRASYVTWTSPSPALVPVLWLLGAAFGCELWCAAAARAMATLSCSCRQARAAVAPSSASQVPQSRPAIMTCR